MMTTGHIVLAFVAGYFVNVVVMVLTLRRSWMALLQKEHDDTVDVNARYLIACGQIEAATLLRRYQKPLEALPCAICTELENFAYEAEPPEPKHCTCYHARDQHDGACQVPHCTCAEFTELMSRTRSVKCPECLHFHLDLGTCPLDTCACEYGKSKSIEPS